MICVAKTLPKAASTMTTALVNLPWYGAADTLFINVRLN